MSLNFQLGPLTITVASTDTSLFSQTWVLTVYDGFNCPAEWTADVYLASEYVSAAAVSISFALPTGETTRVETWPTITLASLAPRVYQLVISLSYTMLNSRDTLSGTARRFSLKASWTICIFLFLDQFI